MNRFAIHSVSSRCCRDSGDRTSSTHQSVGDVSTVLGNQLRGAVGRGGSGTAAVSSDVLAAVR